ncbi:hypothetical protein [Tenacibaculum ovolyticum]|uniref:hypothetical protein n=1 Tax=Tenacibaculum ovolyticum TaxID=104270 RepID=UPI0018D3A7A0|nr:hypothetical protein [Tenacibaculum ovolyticum]
MNYKKRIASEIRKEIENQNRSIIEVSEKSVSNKVVYSILNEKNYTINSLISVVTVLKERNVSFFNNFLKDV